jgi:hypothetical protein
MEQSEIYNYLINKYKQMNLLDSSGNIIESDSGFDFNIYPDSGYIPQCGVCNMMYKNFINDLTSNNTIDAKHISCGCLWFDYYKNKIISINSKVIFSKK